MVLRDTKNIVLLDTESMVPGETEAMVQQDTEVIVVGEILPWYWKILKTSYWEKR